MTESSSDIEAMDVQEADSILSMKENGVLGTPVISTDMAASKLSTSVSDLNENSVTDNSNHEVDLTSDDEASKHSNSPEDKVADSDEKRMPESTIMNDTEMDDGEALTTLASESSKNETSDADVDKMEGETTSSVLGEGSEKESSKEDEELNAKPNSPVAKLAEDLPKDSPEVIIADSADEGPTGSTLQTAETNNSTKGDGENELSENNSKVANEDTAKIASSKDEPETKPKSESKSDTKKEKKKGKTCPECGVKKKLHFRIVFQGKSHQMCSEACYKSFKQKITVPRVPSPKPEVLTIENCAKCQKLISPGQGFYPLLGEIKPLCSEECLMKYHDLNGSKSSCSQCKNKIDSVYTQLIWETMNFCNEECLGQYQSFLGSHCTCCQTPVPQTSLGKYCVCFGADIRQFCSGTCLEDFKKNLKVCSYCQTDLSGGSDGFLAPVGEKGQFKDFCSQSCMERYEVMNNLTKSVPEVLECSHCKKQGNFKIHVKYQNKTHSLCCALCVSGFRCTHRLTDNMCNTCYNFFKPKANETFSFLFDGLPRHFCAKACMTLYVLSHRKIIQCSHCKVKKYTFDMIERIDATNQTQMFCSLNCLQIHRTSGPASTPKVVRCDHCSKSSPAQYHLTMSDATVRNFCCYQCAMTYQNRFTLVPPLTTTGSTRQTITPKTVIKTTTTGTSPVIVSAISLASHPRPIITTAGNKGLASPALVTVRQPAPTNVSLLSPKPPISMPTPVPMSNSTSTGTSPLMREIVVRPPLPKTVKNKSASCRPIMQTKGVNAKLQTCHKAVQTDERPIPIILPIPVPIYVPTPLHLFSRPIGCPVPLPVPVPVPIIVDSNKSKDKQENTQNLFKFGADKASGSLGCKPSEEASCSNNDQSENSNKRKGFDEEPQTQSKKPKFDLTPVSDIDTSNNDLQENDFLSVKNNIPEETSTPLNVT